MGFILNCNTKIYSSVDTKPVKGAVRILERDIEKSFFKTKEKGGEIILKCSDEFGGEEYKVIVGEDIVIFAKDDLGFVYGLLSISERYLGIKPFWFWMNQRIEKKENVVINNEEYISPKYAVRYRGWFFNDEVLLLKWKIGDDGEEAWKMAFEALLRCGGNITVPGTDKTARRNRRMAADMGLWITHHHAEPLGAEMFARVYPNDTPNFTECSEKFYKLWEDAVKEQKDYKTVWNLCFRGQGDKPFWGDDTSGRFDTEQKRGELISSLIKKQCAIVKKYVKNPVFCTNLYGEIMELYKDGYIELDDDIIKVRADNGYGKMVTRRRDNHSARVSSMPEKNGGRQGIYYHVSFYDLQAANHITMLPNSVDFVNKELSEVIENGGDDFWIINCSNVKPHVYYLDAVRKKWLGEDISDKTHSVEFAADYYDGAKAVSNAFSEYPKAMIKYGSNEDEHAGEQLYTESVRIIAHNFIILDRGQINRFMWLTGEGDFFAQTKRLREICASGAEGMKKYFDICAKASQSLRGEVKKLFDETVFLQAKIHYYCLTGLIDFCDSMAEFKDGNYKKAFVLAGNAAEMYDTAEKEMRGSENGIWQEFYMNDCFADIKHSAYMIRKAMGTVREFGDNARHDKWYREETYSRGDRNVMLLLVTDNHMTDEELYNVMKEKNYDIRS